MLVFPGTPFYIVDRCLSRCQTSIVNPSMPSIRSKTHRPRFLRPRLPALSSVISAESYERRDTAQKLICHAMDYSKRLQLNDKTAMLGSLNLARLSLRLTSDRLRKKVRRHKILWLANSWISKGIGVRLAMSICYALARNSSWNVVFR